MGRLSGKVAIVTGAAQGIGKAIAETFAREGAIVIAGDVKPGPAGESWSDIQFLALDVTRQEDWEAAVKTAEKHGRLDILINNAGIVFSYDPIHETSMDTWNKVIAVNQTGTFLGMRAVIPTMCEQKSGSIVNISSIWGVVGAAGVAAYQAAKGAVRTMTKNAAITYAPNNIRSNSIHPGLIWTPLIEAQDNSITESIVAETPLGRPGTAQEVANGALFLASDESSFVTGVELPIDGGFLAK
jgi:NAD(P)-dependent dehydrogenase (short-subunit alcohol dehydrogenase family)